MTCDCDYCEQEPVEQIITVQKVIDFLIKTGDLSVCENAIRTFNGTASDYGYLALQALPNNRFATGWNGNLAIRCAEMSGSISVKDEVVTRFVKLGYVQLAIKAAGILLNRTLNKDEVLVAMEQYFKSGVKSAEVDSALHELCGSVGLTVKFNSLIEKREMDWSL